MDFSYSEIQKMLLSSARDFLKANCPGKYVRRMAEDQKGYTSDLWDQMADMGWMGLIVPEKYGGAGCGLLDLAILLEEMGRVCLPGPFFSTVVLGGFSTLEAGSEDQKSQVLSKLAQGKLLLTLALTEASALDSVVGIKTQAYQKGKEFIINGNKLFVPDAYGSDYFICVAKTKESRIPDDGITLFLVDSNSPGLNYTQLKTIAGDKQYEINLAEVKVPEQNILGKLHEGTLVLQKILEKATVARCAEMAGGARQILELSLNYAKERKTFGHPIGSYQTLQHYFANMLVKSDGIALMVYNTAWRLDEGLPAAREVAMTKALANEFFREIAALCIQIHGAIGFTEDYDAQLYFKRAKAWEISLGSTDFHLDRVYSFRKPENLYSQ
jgi:3-oxocholest-4-en-26-oyl-CoA dehydrogenase beta subunit